MAYVYQADFYCDDCGQAICRKLDAAGKRPTYPKPWDTDDYPSHCEPGESDSPQHCGHCHVHLSSPPTEYGVNYVLCAIQESLAAAVNHGRATTWDRIIPAPGTGEDTEGFRQTWAGMRHVEILREWAKDLRNYSLEKDESALVDLFLELSEPLCS